MKKPSSSMLLAASMILFVSFQSFAQQGPRGRDGDVTGGIGQGPGRQGGGQDRDQPGQPSRPDEPSRPDRPTRPDQPTQPDRPTRPDRPQQPGPHYDDRRDGHYDDRRDGHYDDRRPGPGPGRPGPGRPGPYNDYRPGPSRHYQQQVIAYSNVTLILNQQVRGSEDIDLDQLVRRQTGRTLQGAVVNRISVTTSVFRRGSLSLQALLNFAPVGISRTAYQGVMRLPLEVSAYEDVRDLGLRAYGDGVITSIVISVGRVNSPYYGY